MPLPLPKRLKPACLLLASAASAQTTVSTTTTANLATSSAGDVTVSSAGTVSPASGTAITIDSNNAVSNAGTISYHVVDNSVGIGSAGGIAGSITNTGTIRNDDDYAASDTNGDTIVEAPFAQGTGRYGIAIGGSGTWAGTINNSGTIAIEGNNSYGVSATVPIAGSLVTTGTVSTLGDNATTIGLGRVSGGVTLNGTVSAQGQGSQAVVLGDDVGGNVVIHGALSSTGYSTITLPSSTSALLSTNLQQGGAALTVGGNVAGGVLVGGPLTSTTDTNADTDGDGVADVGEGAGSVASSGAAPGIQVGSATKAITLGAVPSVGAGLVVNGAVSGFGVYAGVNGTAIRIGGVGQTVTLSGGMTVGGTITGRANAATAIAIDFAGGAVVPSLTNSGTISAGLSTTSAGTTQTILVESGARLPAIANTGAITAAASATGSLATAILDRSNTLASVTNTGAISAVNNDNNARAIDVSANTTGFSYSQSLASSTAAAPSLTGAVLTGSGADTIAASAGTIKSNLSLGDGDNAIALSGTAALTGSATMGAGNDSLTLADTSGFSGAVEFGAGANRLAVGSGATFSGTIASTGGTLAMTIASGGTAALTGTGTTSLASLGLGGTLGVTLDPANNAASVVQVTGATTVTSAAAIRATLASISVTPYTATVLRSGSLTGSGNLTLSLPALPYLLTGSLATSDAAGTVAVTIAPKTGAVLGLRQNETVAFPAVYGAIAGTPTLANLFIGLTDGPSTLRRVRQMLPDYEGGVFDVLAESTRKLAPGAGAVPLGQIGDVGLWAQQAYTDNTQHARLTSGYHGTGYGIVGGADLGLGGFGRAGLSIGFLNAETHNSVGGDASADVFQGGAHWLANWGGLRLSADGAAGYVKLADIRNLDSTSTVSTTLLTSRDRWHGLLLSGNAAASYEARLGIFYLRPGGTLTYARLHEQAHAGSGGGTGFDLLYDARTSRELGVNGTVAAGLQFGDRKDPEATVVRLEVEGGRREILSGNAASTTARFAGGSAFTIAPEDRGSGYIGSVRASIGSHRLAVTASGDGETRDGYRSIAIRLGLRGSF